ncbi:EpsG family protein [Paenibacillus sp. LjRoot56]|uniref:EpsG family protein n=1 Tax=Paenibacillus sp. LjRoot56 TaxID=3342333 RepID=UPI003ECD93D1
MSLLIYSLLVIVVVLFAYIKENLPRTRRAYKKFSTIGDPIIIQESRAPIFNILILTIILSLYSAYLATSGKLVDTLRYAWSFLYRYPAYYGSFESLLSAKTEVGYLLINMLIGKITDEPFWLFLFVSFITTFVNLFVASKISKKYTVIIFLYLISLYFFQTTYTLRQALAVSFANFAFLSYLKDFKLRYFLFTILAILFHNTAFILFFAFFIFKIKNSKKTYFYIAIMFFIGFFLFDTLLPKIPFIEKIINTDEEGLSIARGSFNAIFKGIPFYFISVLALVKRNSLKQIIYKADFFIICSVFYSTSWLLTYQTYWFFRMGWYFLLPTLALVPSLFGTIKNPKERVLFYLIFIFALIFITYRQIFITFR